MVERLVGQACGAPQVLQGYPGRPWRYVLALAPRAGGDPSGFPLQSSVLTS
ncbi:hypothetical protein L533_3069 [Bordetella bronchiseptica OSU553]|nr:hypothetical protein L533_3069 [Bordetella bronchiseptica OSU553]